jgi:DNA polymerase III epsilon subunit-like protein
MIFCAVDTETTGLNPQKDRVTELGAVFFNTEDWSRIGVYQSLVWEDSYPEITPEITKITGITLDLLKSKAQKPETVWNNFKNMTLSHGVDAFIAHNATFDRAFVEEELTRNEIELFKKPWVCSIKDIKHTVGQCRKLSHLALDYGVAVDPSTLHRASDDVELMIKMLKQSGCNFEQLVRRSQLKDVVIRAIVPAPFGMHSDGGIGKDKAKACGFNWDAARKIWTKTIKEDELEQEEKELGYKVAIV